MPASSQSWHDPFCSKPCEELGERRLTVADTAEAEPSASPHVRQGLDGATAISIGMPPGGESVDGKVAQAVPSDDRGPDLRGVHHLLLKRHRLSVKRHWFDVQHLSQSRPHAPPAEDVAVDD